MRDILGRIFVPPPMPPIKAPKGIVAAIEALYNTVFWAGVSQGFWAGVILMIVLVLLVGRCRKG